MTSKENGGSPRPRRILTSTGARRNTGPWTASAELESALAAYRRTRRKLIATGATFGLLIVALPLLLTTAFFSLQTTPTVAPAPAATALLAPSVAALEPAAETLAAESAALAERTRQLEERLSAAHAARESLAGDLASAEGTITVLRTQLAREQEILREAARALEERPPERLVAVPVAPPWTASVEPLWSEQVTLYEALAERRRELAAEWAQTRRAHAADLGWIEAIPPSQDPAAPDLRRRTAQLEAFLARPFPAPPPLPQIADEIDSTEAPEPILAAFRTLHRQSLDEAQALQEADSTLALLERELAAVARQRLAAQTPATEATLAVIRPSPPADPAPSPPVDPLRQWPLHALPLQEWNYRTHMSEFAGGLTYTFRVPERGGELIVPFIPYDGWRELIDREARAGRIDRADVARLRDYPAFEQFALSLPALQRDGLYVARSVQFRWEP